MPSLLKRLREAQQVWLPSRLKAAEEEVKDYLSHSIVEPGAEAELRGYLEDSFRRFLITLELMPPGRGTVLELGANPYFLTLLLKRTREYELHLANFFGIGREGVQEIKNDKYGEVRRFYYKEFNIEEDVFPYDDATFEGVIFCEILEHLTQDPVGALAEIHRVLKPGGWLLLTTPNAVRRHNLVRLLRGQNFHDPYSGYGPYGRHNREYTAAELRELLTDCGFAIEVLTTRDLHPASVQSRCLAMLLGPLSGYNLFCRARKAGEFRWYYPPWLFRSGRPRRRVRRPYVRMGVNDAVQLGDGWWEIEHWGDSVGHVRWTTERAELAVRAAGGEGRVQLQAFGGPDYIASPRTLYVTLSLADGAILCEKARLSVPCQGWTDLGLALPRAVPPGEISVVLEVDRAFVPREHGASGDGRRLGVAVKSFELVA